MEFKAQVFPISPLAVKAIAITKKWMPLRVTNCIKWLRNCAAKIPSSGEIRLMEWKRRRHKNIESISERLCLSTHAKVIISEFTQLKAQICMISTSQALVPTTKLCIRLCSAMISSVRLNRNSKCFKSNKSSSIKSIRTTCASKLQTTLLQLNKVWIHLLKIQSIKLKVQPQLTNCLKTNRLLMSNLKSCSKTRLNRKSKRNTKIWCSRKL